MKRNPVPFRRLVLIVAALVAAACLAAGPAAAAEPSSGSLTVPGSTAFPTTTVGAASSAKIALKNSSEAGVNVTEVKIEGVDPGDFGIEGSNCVGFIGPSMGCELSVRFTPGASGLREALLRIVTDGTPAEPTTELSGEGAAPEVTFEPGGHDFGLSEVHAVGTRVELVRSERPNSTRGRGYGKEITWLSSGSSAWREPVSRRAILATAPSSIAAMLVTSPATVKLAKR